MPVPIASQKATEKEIKRAFKEKAQKEPEKYFPVSVLKDEGFSRKKCEKCGNFFWSVTERKVCGEPECSGGYSFIPKSPAGTKMDFIQTWQKFSSVFKKFGYTPIPRYPVAARWRDDTDFVQASIYDFQPYVVSGEIEPPANPLVVPQFCVRFNDLDNVGITGRHYSGFVMIGQHAFVPPKDYAPKEYLRHIYLWLTEGVKIPKTELQFHEDAWAGGGNMGPSIEFFSGGLELGNQVYMQYDVKSGSAKELDIKVLDMGTGQERYAWFTNGCASSYEVVFPTVVDNLRKISGIKTDSALVSKFIPYSGLLNVDEVDDVEKMWGKIAEKMGVDVKELKEKILPNAAIYSIGDHLRSLLITVSDGVLPSNVGGGYNLRVLFRRSYDFIEKYGWKVDLNDVCDWHAKYLAAQYPELTENLEDVKKILDAEKRKYVETRAKSRSIVARLGSKPIAVEQMIELYDSSGISPDALKSAGLTAKIPDNFYKLVAERHEKTSAKAETKKAITLDISGVPETRALYFDDYALIDFSAKVVKIISGKYVVLDATAFYPTSGGQVHDNGRIQNCEITDIFKQGSVIIHELKSINFKEGDTVKCNIDFARRKQLAQHHTATHIVNGAAKKVLGSHIWQAGAEKTPEKSRLDITHYESLGDEEIKKIESVANEIVEMGIPVESKVMGRADAEKEYGFRIYQGGAVPGKRLRIVKINGVDVEACGGTHLHNTKETGRIKILGATKIQDGIVRIEFAAGNSSEKYAKEFEECAKNIRLFAEKITGTKLADPTDEEMSKAAESLSVPSELLLATLEKFQSDCERQEKVILELESELKIKSEETADKNGFRNYLEFSKSLFEKWKKQSKAIDELRRRVADARAKNIKNGAVELVDFDAQTMRSIAEKLDKVLLVNKEGIFVFRGSDAEFKKLEGLGAKGGGKDIKQGRVDAKLFSKMNDIFR